MASLSASSSLLGFRSPSGSGRAQISTTDVLNLKPFASKVSPIPSCFRYFQSVLYFFFFLKLPPFVYFCSNPSIKQLPPALFRLPQCILWIVLVERERERERKRDLACECRLVWILSFEKLMTLHHLIYFVIMLSIVPIYVDVIIYTYLLQATSEAAYVI